MFIILNKINLYLLYFLNIKKLSLISKGETYGNNHISIVVLTHKIRCIIIPNKKDSKKANGYDIYTNKETINFNKIANRINSTTSKIAIFKIRYE